MNFLVHMALVVTLDYLFFLYWYVIANRFTVLNFHEEGFLPGRYIISGLVAGAFIYWAYLISVQLFKRLSHKYTHPRWWTLWLAAGALGGIQVFRVVTGVDSLPIRATPPLEAWEAIALIVHLQAIHLLTFITGQRVSHEWKRILLPGVGAGVLFMGLWLFWIGYSFFVVPEADPSPIIGTEIERFVQIIILSLGVMIGLVYLLRIDVPFVDRDKLLIPRFRISVGDVLTGFYSAWALFYLITPVVHYGVRGYVTAHSNLFPAFLLGLLVPLVWSLGVMWLVIWLCHPALGLPYISLPALRQKLQRR